MSLSLRIWICREQARPTGWVLVFFLLFFCEALHRVGVFDSIWVARDGNPDIYIK